MRNTSFKDEAEKCRRLALEYSGGAEGAFLLRVAGAFEAMTNQPPAEAHREDLRNRRVEPAAAASA